MELPSEFRSFQAFINYLGCKTPYTYQRINDISARCAMHSYCKFELEYEPRSKKVTASGVHSCYPRICISRNRIYFLESFLSNMNWVARMRGFPALEISRGEKVVMKCSRCPAKLELHEAGSCWLIKNITNDHTCPMREPESFWAFIKSYNKEMDYPGYFVGRMHEYVREYVLAGGLELKYVGLKGGARTHRCANAERTQRSCAVEYRFYDNHMEQLGQHSCRIDWQLYYFRTMHSLDFPKLSYKKLVIAYVAFDYINYAKSFDMNIFAFYSRNMLSLRFPPIAADTPLPLFGIYYERLESRCVVFAYTVRRVGDRSMFLPIAYFAAHHIDDIDWNHLAMKLLWFVADDYPGLVAPTIIIPSFLTNEAMINGLIKHFPLATIFTEMLGPGNKATRALDMCIWPSPQGCISAKSLELYRLYLKTWLVSRYQLLDYFSSFAYASSMLDKIQGIFLCEQKAEVIRNRLQATA